MKYLSHKSVNNPSRTKQHLIRQTKFHVKLISDYNDANSPESQRAWQREQEQLNI